MYAKQNNKLMCLKYRIIIIIIIIRIIIIRIIIIIVLYYRLAEHINRYMPVVQYIVITLHTRVQLLSSQ